MDYPAVEPLEQQLGAAVISILRSTRRLVASGMSAVVSRNGTSNLGSDPDQEQQECVDDEGGVQRFEVFHRGSIQALAKLSERESRP